MNLKITNKIKKNQSDINTICNFNYQYFISKTTFLYIKMNESVSRLRNRIAQEEKSIEYTRLQNQINMLKTKLRSNRNQDTRNKIEYRMTTTQTEITNNMNRLNEQKKKYANFISQLQNEIEKNKAYIKQLNEEKEKEQKQYENMKNDISELLTNNKAINLNIVNHQKKKRDLVEELNKMDRLIRVVNEDNKQIKNIRQKNKTELQDLEKKIIPFLSQKLQKLKNTHKTLKDKIVQQQKEIENGNQQIKKLYNQGMELALNQQQLSHKTMLNRQLQKDLQHKQKQLINKGYNMKENLAIEQDRQQLLKHRIASIDNQLKQQINIETYELQIQSKKEKLENLKSQLQKIIEENKKKNANNNKNLNYLESLTKNDQFITNLCNRQQTVREMKNKCRQEYQTPQRIHKQLQNQLHSQTKIRTQIQPIRPDNNQEHRFSQQQSKVYSATKQSNSLYNNLREYNHPSVQSLVKQSLYLSRRSSPRLQIGSNKKIYK